jgi:RNA polymerase sigma factor (sigma-70 family)
MLRAFSHLKDFQEKSSFSTWLTRIAINSALMILRKKRGCYEISFDGIDDSGDNYERWEVESPAENPESRLARKEREELLRDAILRLPQVLREVVELRQARGYSTREIAQALGISVPAVKSRLSRARLTLRTALRPLDLLSPEIVARVRQALHAGILCWRQAFESAAAERSIPRGYLVSSLTKRRSPCIASDYDERFWVRHGPSGPARIRRRSRIRFEASIIRFHFLEAPGHSAL